MMKAAGTELANVLVGTIAGLFGLCLIGATMLPLGGALQEIEQSVLFGLLVVIYQLDGAASKRRKRPIARVTISVLTLFLTLRYLDWRFTQTLPFGYGDVNLILGIALLGAELHGIISAIMGQIINIHPLDRTLQTMQKPTSSYPSVDVLIPTYNEDVDVVETTVIAATQLDYPRARHKVYILDDGGTDAKLAKPGEAGEAARERAAALRQLATKYGATYLTRAKNEHAKAGNLNHALQHISGDLILILDCDHVPSADFLRRTVGFFKADPKLFLLQTPHNFITPDPIERNLSTFDVMPAENELFYNIMQPGLDFWGAAFFCGSAAILRRHVLDEIGGISGKSITEDAETTVKAMCRGYRTAYYNRPMVSGLQPETFTGFILQRIRWAQGMLQIFMLDNVWFKPRLSFMQRLLFTNFAFYWMFPLARAILLLMPPLFLFFGFNVAVTTPRQLLVYAVPYYLAAILNSQYYYGRVRWPFISQIYETAQTVFLAVGIFSVIRHPRAPSFKVTPKGEMLDKDFISPLTWPFYALFALAASSLVIDVWRVITEPQLRWALVFVGFWVILDVAVLLGVIGALTEHKQMRRLPRVRYTEPVYVRAPGGPWCKAQGRDLSRGGAGILLQDPSFAAEVGQDVELLIAAEGMPLASKIVHVAQAAEGGLIVGLQYRAQTVGEARTAVAAAFGSSARLVWNMKRKHRGVSGVYGFLFLFRIGFRGTFRHLRIAALMLAARLGRIRRSRRSVTEQDVTPRVPMSGRRRRLAAATRN